MTYTYGVHGIVTVASDLHLPELGFFEGRRGGPWRLRVARRRPARPSYAEPLARLRVERLDDLEVEVWGLPALSPHVAYTNIVEPLLRLLVAWSGHALIHAACLERGGRGLLISAPPDTGKTSTVLRLLRRGGYRFLSDDLTLLSPGPRLRCYPKPLTISSHTLAAMGGRPGLWFRVRSKVHSREGRGVYRAASSVLPPLTINSLAQVVFRPPKLHVWDVVPGVEVAWEARPAVLVFLSRRGEGVRRVRPEAAAEMLLASTREAYETPPYDRWVTRVEGYREAMDAERGLVEELVHSVDSYIVHSEARRWDVEVEALL